MPKRLLDNVLALPVADRQELFDRLWDSLLHDPALTDAQRALLDARLADMELHPDDEMSLEEVDATLRERR